MWWPKLALSLPEPRFALLHQGLGAQHGQNAWTGSITPTSDQTEAFHKYIEFGNRLLTFVLLIVAIASLFAVFKHNRERRVVRSLTKRQIA
jgi:heme a synthase